MTRGRRILIALAAPVVVGGALLALYLRGSLTSRAAVRSPGVHAVGVTTLASPGGPIELWYPARDGAGDGRVRYEEAYLGYATRDAPALDGAARPLAVLVHGYTASRFELAWLGERLASAGYVSIAIDYADQGAPMDGDHACKRARETSAALDAVSADGRWSARASTDRVLVVGHSFGGTTALALAGAPLRRPLACADKRVAAAIVTAPPVGPIALERLAEATPALVAPPIAFAGTGDSLHDSSVRLSRAWPGARLESVDGAGHFAFKGVCTPYARARMAMQCVGRAGVDRVALHDRVARSARELFEQIERASVR
ncbi:MAG: alpha/beta fold hydrolase [Myxococcales bacterium]|nr:alpha/beta fold hydrolase [Myxococcales bacterium]